MSIKLAIVGTSQNLMLREKELIKSTIHHYCLTFRPMVIISGGAWGVDFMAKEYALEHKIPYHEFAPKDRTTPSLLARNKEIARMADIILVISTKRIITRRCYHHWPWGNHQKTAGCYTGKIAEQLNKRVILVTV